MGRNAARPAWSFVCAWGAPSLFFALTYPLSHVPCPVPLSPPRFNLFLFLPPFSSLYPIHQVLSQVVGTTLYFLAAVPALGFTTFSVQLTTASTTSGAGAGAVLHQRPLMRLALESLRLSVPCPLWVCLVRCLSGPVLPTTLY